MPLTESTPPARPMTPRGRRLQRRPRRGFIILFGSRAIVSDDTSAAPVRGTCPNCGRQSDLVPKTFRNWFTLFFIPIFPISGRTPFMQCSNCGAQLQAAPQEIRTHMAAADRQQNQQAIALYNSLRSSPANSVALNQLMMTYASMGDFDPAVSAAAEFPQALNNSEQCMVTLGRVYLAQNKYEDALRWLDAAVVRNPALGEGQYYKAIAHLMQTPPQADRAVAAARAARAAGHPGSEELLREAEAKAREG